MVRPAHLVLAVVVFALGLFFGCRSKGGSATEGPGQLPVVTEATTNLLLTWVDEKGEFHREERATDVPVSARDVVRIHDPAREPSNADEIFVADLRTAGPEGVYPVRTMKRAEFESLAVARRSKKGLTAQPAASAGASSADPARPAVIIYGASWCGPCHQAAAHLKRRGVAFVEKDIEQDNGAAREMHAKLARAGRQGGSIPVLDVRGTILVGFDPNAVDRALGEPL